MRVRFGVVAGLAAFSIVPAWGAEIFSGDTAEAIYAAIQSGRGWCQVTTQVINPTTQVVEQTMCRCVSSVDGRTADVSGRTTALVLSFGPEQQCAPPAATPQQAAAARAQIADIDNRLAALNNFLQHIWDSRDQYAYDNDPTYKAQYDAWVQYWANYGTWAVQQLQAARQGDVSVANSVPPAPAGGGAPPAPAGGGAGAAPVGVGAGGGPVVNPSVPQTPAGPGLLGVPMEQPQ
jgi:hypothetical protein